MLSNLKGKTRTCPLPMRNTCILWFSITLVLCLVMHLSMDEQRPMSLGPDVQKHGPSRFLMLVLNLLFFLKRDKFVDLG